MNMRATIQNFPDDAAHLAAIEEMKARAITAFPELADDFPAIYISDQTMGGLWLHETNEIWLSANLLRSEPHVMAGVLGHELGHKIKGHEGGRQFNYYTNKIMECSADQVGIYLEGGIGLQDYFRPMVNSMYISNEVPTLLDELLESGTHPDPQERYERFKDLALADIHPDDYVPNSDCTPQHGLPNEASLVDIGKQFFASIIL